MEHTSHCEAGTCGDGAFPRLVPHTVHPGAWRGQMPCSVIDAGPAARPHSCVRQTRRREKLRFPCYTPAMSQRVASHEGDPSLFRLNSDSKSRINSIRVFGRFGKNQKIKKSPILAKRAPSRLGDMGLPPWPIKSCDDAMRFLRGTVSASRFSSEGTGGSAAPACPHARPPGRGPTQQRRHPATLAPLD